MNEFSLKIRSNQSSILYENSSFVCRYRQTILEHASSIGGTIVNIYEIYMPTEESFNNIMDFLSFLQIRSFAINVNKNTIASFSKTKAIENDFKKIKECAESLSGTFKTESFEFQSVLNAQKFLEFISKYVGK